MDYGNRFRMAPRIRLPVCSRSSIAITMRDAGRAWRRMRRIAMILLTSGSSPTRLHPIAWTYQEPDLSQKLNLRLYNQDPRLWRVKTSTPRACISIQVNVRRACSRDADLPTNTSQTQNRGCQHRSRLRRRYYSRPRWRFAKDLMSHSI